MFGAAREPRNERLFGLIGTLGCVSGKQLHRLFFGHSFLPSRRNHGSRSDGISYSAVRARLQVLKRGNYIRDLGFKMPGRGASGVQLTDRGRRAFPRVARFFDETVTEVSSNQARRGWQRAQVWARVNQPHHKWRIGQSSKARRVLEKQTRATIPLSGVLPYDILVNIKNSDDVVRLLLVDNLDLDIVTLVHSLPFDGDGGRVRVVPRPNDFTSIWESRARRWHASPRFASFLNALEETGRVRVEEPTVLLGVGALIVEGI